MSPIGTGMLGLQLVELFGEAVEPRGSRDLLRSTSLGSDVESL